MSASNGKLRILQVHNQYSPGWGGEDTVVQLEAQLLRDRGHVVGEFKVSTAALKNGTAFRQMLAAPSFLWSRQAYQNLRREISEFQPDVVHVHNTFPKLSPSVFWASRRAGVPVVQTLHNFRHLCANALLLRDGRRCEECVAGPSWSALRHRCYSKSFARTAVVAAVNSLHKTLGTYSRAVDAYILLNKFNREIFLRGKFPAHKLVVKPNFVPVSELGQATRKPQVVFAGELTRNKGVPVLLVAWGIAALDGFQLLLIGDGPERAAMEGQYARLPGISWRGRLSRAEVLEHIAASRALVFPSLAYENCPMVVLEALSVATPVVASNHPGLQAMIAHQREGMLFQAGDPQALAAAMREVVLANQDTWSQLSSAARHTQAERYSDDVSYGQLISIYRRVIQHKSAPVSDIEVQSAT